MYGTVKSRIQKDGVVAGKYAGIVFERNLLFIQMLSSAHPKLTETGLCNKILNDKLDELRELYQSLTPPVKPFMPGTLSKLTVQK